MVAKLARTGLEAEARLSFGRRIAWDCAAVFYEANNFLEPPINERLVIEGAQIQNLVQEARLLVVASVSFEVFFGFRRWFVNAAEYLHRSQIRLEQEQVAQLD
jgi:hypothetical protein